VVAPVGRCPRADDGFHDVVDTAAWHPPIRMADAKRAACVRRAWLSSYFNGCVVWAFQSDVRGEGCKYWRCRVSNRYHLVPAEAVATGIGRSPGSSDGADEFVGAVPSHHTVGKVHRHRT